LIERLALNISNQISAELRCKPGSSITVEIDGIDNGLPTISAHALLGPNANGWNNTIGTVSFTCADASSGIAFYPQPQVVPSDGAMQAISGTVIYQAGNTATIP
jgi:hypothetical protein